MTYLENDRGTVGISSASLGDVIIGLLMGGCSFVIGLEAGGHRKKSKKIGMSS